jgi:hypothetical protein
MKLIISFSSQSLPAHQNLIIQKFVHSDPAGDTRHLGCLFFYGWLTISLPSIPAWRWPATEQ